MKTYVIQTVPADFVLDIQPMQNKGVELVLLFMSSANCREPALAGIVMDALPGAQLIGCSTSGEIGERLEDDTLTLMGIKFDSSPFRCAAVPIRDAAQSRAAGQALAEQLGGDGLAGLFVLLPGVNVNGSQFTAGLKKALPPHVAISGGLAGDGLAFRETFTIFNGRVSPQQAVAVGLYGDRIKIGTGSRGGWKPFGPRRRVTKADHNILYEIDGAPALTLYKQYLGNKAADLPSSGLLYPFAIMDETSVAPVGLVRTILDTDEDADSLILAGDMDTGQVISLMHANTGELVAGAQEAAGIALNGAAATKNDAVICVSCIGRKILMGGDTEDELDAVRAVFPCSKIAGFYSYGEICTLEDSGAPELHNQTMTVTYISEAT